MLDSSVSGNLIKGQRVDINGGLSIDMRPMFPPPIDLLKTPIIETNGSYSALLKSLVISMVSHSKELVQVAKAFSHVVRLSNFINQTDTMSQCVGNDRLFLENYATALHEILILLAENLTTHGDHDDIKATKESIRLAFLLYLALIKRRMGAVPDCVARRREALNSMLDRYYLDYPGFLEIKLWILTVLAVATDEKERIGVVGKIVELMRNLEIDQWSVVEHTIREIAWGDDVIAGGQALASLGEQVQHRQSLV
jgi:hypothetical protein